GPAGPETLQRRRESSPRRAPRQDKRAIGRIEANSFVLLRAERVWNRSVDLIRACSAQSHSSIDLEAQAFYERLELQIAVLQKRCQLLRRVRLSLEAADMKCFLV